MRCGGALAVDSAPANPSNSAPATPSTSFLLMEEITDINYDEMIKQIANVAMIVGIVYVVLRGLKEIGLTQGILAVPMSNVLRTSMLAAVVLPILGQQTRNLVVEGTDATPKVARNVAVAAALAYVLLVSPAQASLGPPLIKLGARAPAFQMPMGMSAAQLPARMARM